MKYGLISDIHGNLEALKKVLEILSEEGVDKYICLGDIVGYGANPRECIKEVKKLKAVCIAGNHDWAGIGETDIEFFNPYAKEAILWTQQELKKRDKDYLKSLPLAKVVDDFTIVHATLDEPEEWKYFYSTYHAHKNFQILTTPLCFVGHSHIPIIFLEKDYCTYSKTSELQLEEDYKYIVNIGSVGQPRDGDPRASFAIYDNEEKKVVIKRVDYDIKTAQEKILEAELPPILAERLAFGE